MHAKKACTELPKKILWQSEAKMPHKACTRPSIIRSSISVILYTTACVVSSLGDGVKNTTLMAAQPNIIFVMADDHGYGDAGFTGHPFVQTPNLDKMSKNGTVLNRFYASAPVCSPTRASVMTGRHPFRGNVPNHGHYLRPDEITLAERLKSCGYVTGHFGKWHIGSVQPESPTCPGEAGFDEWLSGLNFFDLDPYLSDNGIYKQFKGSGSVITMDATLEFLKKHKDSDSPMFAVTWFPSPHDPQREIPSYLDEADKLYDEQDTRKPGYFREITVLDYQVGRLRSALREWGIEKETLLIYTSDNGGLVGESSGGRAMKGSIYEGGLRVPTIFEWPGSLKAKSIDTPAYSSDFYPTLTAIAGCELVDQPLLDGIDLSKILKGSQERRSPMGFWHGYEVGQATFSDRVIRELMEASESNGPNPHSNRLLKNVKEFPKRDPTLLKGHAAWNDWPWKLHRIDNNDGVKIELYHLADDPMESRNIAKKQPEIASKMRASLEQWQRSVLRSWEGADYPQP